MSHWRDKLLPASFRAVEFFIASAEDVMGRKTIVHEYPDRINPYVEDLGEVTRKITFNAYVLGKDYLDKRVALEKALAKKGAGTLIHPYYGSIYVALSTPITVAHSYESGGMSIFTLEFVRVDSPKDADANASINEGQKIKNKSKEILKLIGQTLQELLQIKDFGDYVKGKVKVFANSQLAKITQVLGVSPLAVHSFAESFLASEDTIGHNYVGAMQESMQGANPHSILAIGKEVQEITVPEMIGSSQKAIKISEKAFACATKQACICLALQTFATYIPKTRQDAQKVREEVLILLDEAAYNAHGMSDEIFASLADLRVFALRALAKNIGQAPHVFKVKTVTSRPALELSYFYLGNLSAEKDMANRNSFEHPGFIVGGVEFEISSK